jgi:hypothetical protein
VREDVPTLHDVFEQDPENPVFRKLKELAIDSEEVPEGSKHRDFENYMKQKTERREPYTLLRYPNQVTPLRNEELSEKAKAPLASGKIGFHSNIERPRLDGIGLYDFPRRFDAQWSNYVDSLAAEQRTAIDSKHKEATNSRRGYILG